MVSAKEVPSWSGGHRGGWRDEIRRNPHERTPPGAVGFEGIQEIQVVLPVKLERRTGNRLRKCHETGSRLGLPEEEEREAQEAGAKEKEGAGLGGWRKCRIKGDR